MIDSHCHILPGLDDGSKTTDESVEIARILAEAGFSQVCCTPHLIKGVFDNEPGKVRKALRELQKALDDEEIPITLSAGFEYHLDEFLPDYLDDPLTLANSTCLLVEASVNANFDFVKDSIYQVVRKGFVPVLAHPERYAFLDQDVHLSCSKGNSPLTIYHSRSKCNPFSIPDSRSNSNSPFSILHSRFTHLASGIQHLVSGTKLPEAIVQKPASGIELLKDMGCLFQGNIGSFAGVYGEGVRDHALRLLQSGHYDRLGTDAHKPQKLADWLARGLKVIEQHIGQDRLKKMISMPVGQNGLKS